MECCFSSTGKEQEHPVLRIMSYFSLWGGVVLPVQGPNTGKANSKCLSLIARSLNKQQLKVERKKIKDGELERSGGVKLPLKRSDLTEHIRAYKLPFFPRLISVGTWWWWKNDLVYFLSMTEGIYRDT